MCFSALGQIVYGILMIVCVAMTAASLFSNSWSQVKNDVKHGNGGTGIMPWNCVPHSHGTECSNWWKSTPDWQRAVVVLMCMALAFEVLALIWNVITFFACCCKKFIIHPLSFFAFVITVLLVTAVIIYGVNNKDLFKNNVQNGLDTSLGWSFWVAVGATIVAAVDTVVGALTVCLGESCC